MTAPLRERRTLNGCCWTLPLRECRGLEPRWLPVTQTPCTPAPASARLPARAGGLRGPVVSPVMRAVTVEVWGLVSRCSWPSPDLAGGGGARLAEGDREAAWPGPAPDCQVARR